jgi:P27 family predicted phage terminase small subunit
VGKRGPVVGATLGQPRGRPSHKASPPPAKRAKKTVTKAVAALPSIAATAPPPPEHLGAVGQATWRSLWEMLPILSPRIDDSLVRQFCEVTEDASRARAAVHDHGLLISEAKANPSGGTIGFKLTLNPAEMALRRTDKTLLDLSDRLGLSPASRARLGLTINRAELAVAEATRVLHSMYTPVIDAETNRQ